MQITQNFIDKLRATVNKDLAINPDQIHRIEGTGNHYISLSSVVVDDQFRKFFSIKVDGIDYIIYFKVH